MEKIDRVFFHELGHFAARELNCKLYVVPHPTAIDIYPCHDNGDEYCGTIRFDLAIAASHGPVARERLAGYIAATIYGCLFQAYFQHVTLDIALDINGQEDLKHWAGALVTHGVRNRNIHAIQNRYFENLVENKSLDGFASLIPKEFLERKTNNSFTVQMERLWTAIQPLLETHFSDYQTFIDDLNKEILEK